MLLDIGKAKALTIFQTLLTGGIEVQQDKGKGKERASNADFEKERRTRSRGGEDSPSSEVGCKLRTLSSGIAF